MATPTELEEKFWKALQSDMTVMLGIQGSEDGHLRPMTAQLDDGKPGSIWFFTSKDNALARGLSADSRAIASFVARGHDLFASVHGSLALETDRGVLDRLWNKFIAAWFEGGKDDPKLALLRLDPDQGEVWLNGSSVVAGIKMLLGVDPKRDYRDKVAHVDLRN
ncbi:MAG: pyridoxamine 5'-phosphate oxidase family protein [Pseudomonadota bacterium]